MATNEEAAYILQLQETIQQLREKLRVAEDELLRVKEICLREVGVGIVNEVVLAKIREVK